MCNWQHFHAVHLGRHHTIRTPHRCIASSQSEIIDRLPHGTSPFETKYLIFRTFLGPIDNMLGSRGIRRCETCADGLCVSALADRNFSSLSTLQEYRGASTVEMDRQEPLEGEEEKVPFWEDENMRAARRSSTAKMLSTVRSVIDRKGPDD